MLKINNIYINKFFLLSQIAYDKKDKILNGLLIWG